MYKEKVLKGIKMNCIKKIANVFVLLLMTTGATFGMDIFQAARDGNIGRIEALLANGADVNQQDHDGMTPLHWAAYKGHEAIVARLIQAKAKVNLRDNSSYTALHKAAMNGHETSVLRLIKAGAYIDQQDCEEGLSALHMAAYRGHEQVVLRLIEEGAYINQPDHEHWTPWHWAMRFGHEAVASRFEAAIASSLIKTNRTSDSTYYGEAASYINNYIKRIEQARQRVPVIAHRLASATHPRLGAESPLALLPQDLLHYITHLVAQAEAMDACRPRPTV